MLKIRAILLMALLGMSGVATGRPQTTTAAPVDHAAAEGSNAGGSSAPDTRTEKQKALAAQTERLFAMATELKEQVDLTNKNILSLKVVQKAEAIEALAKDMRGQTKK